MQKLMRRWWYAIEWPSQADLAKVGPRGRTRREPVDELSLGGAGMVCRLFQPVPAGYQQLDGYPGVYICVKGDDMGKIIDHRTHSEAPSFENLKAKSCQELQDLLVKVGIMRTSPLSVCADCHIVLHPAPVPSPRPCKPSASSFLNTRAPTRSTRSRFQKTLPGLRNSTVRLHLAAVPFSPCELTRTIYVYSGQRGQGAMSGRVAVALSSCQCGAMSPWALGKACWQEVDDRRVVCNRKMIGGVGSDSDPESGICFLLAFFPRTARAT